MTETAQRAYTLVDPAKPQTEGAGRINAALAAIDTDVAAALVAIADVIASKAETTQVAADIAAAIDQLKGDAPEAYDTLVEIAAKLADNDDVVGSIMSSLATKANAANVYSRSYLDAAFMQTGRDALRRSIFVGGR